MVDEMNEAKETGGQDETMMSVDEFLDAHEGEGKTPPASSTGKEPEEETEEKDKSEGADLAKKGDKSESEEDIPKEFHKHEAWQRLKTQRDEAMKKAEEAQKGGLSQSEIDEFKQITSSPEYVRLKMESQGYKPEVIEDRLKQMGHDVPTKTVDDVELVLKTLNIDKNSLSEEARNYVNVYISDAAKVADIIVKDRLAKILPETIKPLKEAYDGMSQETSAQKLAQAMKSQVEKEGVLDFQKDVVPELSKYMESKPDATQADIRQFFLDRTRELTIERSKTGKRQAERDEKKVSMRAGEKTVSIPAGKLPELTGDLGKDMDAALDALEAAGRRF